MRPLLSATLVPAALLPACLLFALPGCGHDAPGVAGTGSGPSRGFAIGDFTAVAAAGSDDVDVRTGAGFSVRAEGDPAVLDHLRIRRDGATLTIGREPGWHPAAAGSAKVFVTMPRLDEASVTGSGGMVVNAVLGDTFKGNAAGSGNLTVHKLAVGALDLSVAGSGDMAMTGRARKLDVSVAGSGGIDARSLVASAASVNVMGSGSVRATVEGEATVAMMGSGSVELGGKARCSVTKVGSGSVTCGG
ncbi:head GIN domain-containing protein [Sphingomonas bacterium]|uniref:head GIN domain-containing protein n=1 Tax=Sphingomonas bacterium TaxID=1895847 RepID=UPI001576CE90|nr:head GIN domain-containing protein [Sphingomonas bacterium]